MTLTQQQFARLTLEEARDGVRNGDFTPLELLDASLARMDAFEPVVNAVITRNDDDARRAAADSMGKNLPLAGIPVAMKDNIQTKGVRTTCASRILDNYVPPYSATVVEKLQDAGAYVNGKTNMDEFAMGASGETSAFGPTRNPWNPKLVPGGSSSGSAALVAYGGALASLASDTGGSIRQPALFCGLVGMKPTYGRVSRNGVAALASSLDQVGPLTRTVRDNALVLDLISGLDPLDSTSAPQADTAVQCLTDIEEGVKGFRVAFDPSILARDGLSPEMAGAVRRAVDICRDNGAVVREVEIPYLDYGVAAYYIINFCEASANMARFDGVRYGRRRGEGDLWDIFSQTRELGFGDEVKRRIMMGSYALSSGYYDAYYLKAARVRRLFAREIEKLFADVDVVILPVSPRPARELGAPATVLDNYLGDIFTLPASLTSLPALSFPVEVVGGLPTGVQAMAPRFHEHVLYQVARTVEKYSQLPGAPWTKSQPEVEK